MLAVDSTNLVLWEICRLAHKRVRCALNRWSNLLRCRVMSSPGVGRVIMLANPSYTVRYAVRFNVGGTTVSAVRAWRDECRDAGV